MVSEPKLCTATKGSWLEKLTLEHSHTLDPRSAGTRGAEGPGGHSDPALQGPWARVQGLYGASSAGEVPGEPATLFPLAPVHTADRMHSTVAEHYAGQQSREQPAAVTMTRPLLAASRLSTTVALWTKTVTSIERHWQRCCRQFAARSKSQSHCSKGRREVNLAATREIHRKTVLRPSNPYRVEAHCLCAGPAAVAGGQLVLLLASGDGAARRHGRQREVHHPAPQ